MLSYKLSDYWLIPLATAVDYSGDIETPTHHREPVMARYVHIAVGALLLSLAGASAYELCQENPLLQQTSVYQLR